MMIIMLKKRNRIISILFLNILIINLGIIEISAISSSESNIEDYQWIVKPGYSSEYEVLIESNSSINTTVDEIIQEYNLLNLTENLQGNKAFSINASTVTYKYNLTEIAKDILNFTGPIMVKRLINNISVPIQRYTLPFYIPIDHWSELDIIFNELLPNANWVDYDHNILLDEYLYSMNWYDSETGLVNDYWFKWSGPDGVLGGFGISVSNNLENDLEKDAISIEISSLYVPNTEHDGDISTLIMTVVILILFLAVFTSITYYINERRGTLYKKKKES